MASSASDRPAGGCLSWAAAASRAALSALHGCDQVRDQVVPPGQLDVDATPGGVDERPLANEPVVHDCEAEPGQHQDQDDGTDHESHVRTPSVV
jgi:hypothetical protein